MYAEKVILSEMGTYNIPRIRPYKFQNDYDSVEALKIATQGASFMDRNTIASAQTNLLRPSPETQGNVLIANGWETPRFAFMMVLNETTASGVNKFIACGYTDHSELSPITGLPDPMMKVYFNTVFKTSVVPMQGTQTPVMVNRVDGCEQIIANHSDLRGTSSPTTTLRPEDVFVNMAASAFSTGDDEIVYVNSEFNPAVGGVKHSSIQNLSPSAYLSNILNKYSQTLNQADVNNASWSDMMFEAKGSIAAMNFIQDSTMNYLRDNSNMTKDGFILWRDICNAVPNFEQVADIRKIGATHRQEYHSAGQTDPIHGSDPTSITVAILQNLMIEIMTNNFITELAAGANNVNVSNTANEYGTPYNCFILSGRSFADGMDNTAQLQNVMSRLHHEVMPMLTHNNQQSVEFSVNMNLFGESTITASVNGASPLTAVVASFSNTLVAPIIGGDRASLSNVAVGISSLAGELGIGNNFGMANMQQNYMPQQQPLLQQQQQQPMQSITSMNTGNDWI